MAEETKEKTADAKEPDKEKKPASGILVWLIMAAIIVLCAGSGLVLGKLFAKPQPAAAEANDQNSSPEKPKKKNAEKPADSKPAAGERYYNLEPVVANLNEPGATRYARITLTLELYDDVDFKTASQIIEEKKPVITNWLTIYLANLSINDIQGDKNLKRIQNQILDSFNEKLIAGSDPDSRPILKSILFKELAIQ